jgi:hypothetical protein
MKRHRLVAVTGSLLVVLAALTTAAAGRVSEARAAGVATPIVVDDAAELQAALVEANAGRRIVVRRGTYLVDGPLVLPDGASLEGEGVMLGDRQPTGFAPGTETRIQALPVFAGDLLTLGDDTSVSGLVIADAPGRAGNPVAILSRAPGDSIDTSIEECEVFTPNPALVAPEGPTGRAIALFTRNPSMGAPPAAHEGAVLSLRLERSLVRSANGGRPLFAVNFAAGGGIHLRIGDSVLIGQMDLAGGVSRPDSVTGAETTLDSRRTTYIGQGLPAIGWTVSGASTVPIPLPAGATSSNTVRIRSVGDRIENVQIGIVAEGGRRFTTASAPSSGNVAELRLLGLTLDTQPVAGFPATDLVLSGARAAGAFTPGDDNTLTIDIHHSTGSGLRDNVYANSLGGDPTNLGVGNRLIFHGSPTAFERSNTALEPPPPAEFFTGGGSP